MNKNTLNKLMYKNTLTWVLWGIGGWYLAPNLQHNLNEYILFISQSFGCIVKISFWQEKLVIHRIWYFMAGRAQRWCLDNSTTTCPPYIKHTGSKQTKQWKLAYFVIHRSKRKIFILIDHIWKMWAYWISTMRVIIVCIS